MYKYCFALIFCAAFLYVQGEELTKEHATSVAHECKEESGATDDDIEAFLKHEIAESKEAKCLRACVSKKFNIMSEDGKLIKEGALKIVELMAQGDADKLAAGEEIVEECVGIEVSEDHCEAAGEYEACLKQHAHDKGLSAPEF